MTMLINAASLADGRAVHELCRRLLELPDYYGCNADALYDCLSERREPISLIVTSLEGSPAEKELRKVLQVVEDLGGDTALL